MAEQRMHGFRARLDYILKHNYWFNKCFSSSVSLALKTLGLFIRTDERLVIFSAISRKYNDSPRALYEYMMAHPVHYGQYRCVWALEDPDNEEIPGSPQKVKADTVAYFMMTLRAKYWITSVNIERGLHYKKRKCHYLNTWHGTPFKHVGNDAGGRSGYDFSNVDYFCYASEYEKCIFRRAFRVRNESMIPTGLPRNDELYHTTSEEIEAIKRRLGLPLEKKVVLYAPTWRDSVDNGKTYAIAPPIDAARWELELGGEYTILFRMHAYTTTLLGLQFNETLRDFSSYSSVNELFKVADILISDYSASMADYAILERPIICFTYDYEQYRKERGLYVDFEKDIPSGVLKTEEEVIHYLKTMDYGKECEKTRTMIKEKLITFGGNATRQCLEYLLGTRTI